jgi:hypothetical protein
MVRMLFTIFVTVLFIQIELVISYSLNIKGFKIYQMLSQHISGNGTVLF